MASFPSKPLGPGERRNHSFIIAPSAAYTATQTFGPFENYHYSKLIIDFVATVEVDTASVVITVEALDPHTRTAMDTALLTSAAITAVGDAHLEIAPEITAVANLAASKIVPLLFQVTVTHADADAFTYSISGTLLE